MHTRRFTYAASFTALISIVLFILLGCGDDSGTNNAATGRMTVEVFDAPPPEGIEAINLSIQEIQIHSDAEGWMVLGQPDTTINFLDLVNGVTLQLLDEFLEVGHYSQMRFVLGESNSIVIDGDTSALTVPSGSESGLKINLNVTIEPDELIEVYVDCDLSNAVETGSGEYLLTPTFKAFMKNVSTSVSGNVSNPIGNGIEAALVTATSAEYSSSALTDPEGDYTLILPSGTYDLEAMASGYIDVDTTYLDVDVDANLSAGLSGYDFVLIPAL